MVYHAYRYLTDKHEVRVISAKEFKNDTLKILVRTEFEDYQDELNQPWEDIEFRLKIDSTKLNPGACSDFYLDLYQSEKDIIIRSDMVTILLQVYNRTQCFTLDLSKYNEKWPEETLRLGTCSDD